MKDKHKDGNAQIEDLTFNGDTDDHYAARYSENGGNDASDVPADSIQFGIDSEDDEFAVVYIKNPLNKEKLVTGHTNARGTIGDNAIGNRLEVAGKWTENAQIIRVTLTNAPHSGDLDEDSEMIVLGCDDDETSTTGASASPTHTDTNFWQEIAEVTLDDAGHITTGTETFPKYLYGEFVATGAGNNGSRPRLRFNDDAASNYCTRFQNNGGTDETSLNYESLYISESDIDQGCLASFFIINVSDKEKLVIYESIRHSSNGASAIPSRFEGIGKWANVGGLITEIQIRGSNNTGSDATYAFTSGSTLRIWGSN